jgi:hypothetical protein
MAEKPHFLANFATFARERLQKSKLIDRKTALTNRPRDFWASRRHLGRDRADGIGMWPVTSLEIAI